MLRDRARERLREREREIECVCSCVRDGDGDDLQFFIIVVQLRHYSLADLLFGFWFLQKKILFSFKKFSLLRYAGVYRRCLSFFLLSSSLSLLLYLLLSLAGSRTIVVDERHGAFRRFNFGNKSVTSSNLLLLLLLLSTSSDFLLLLIFLDD